MDKIERNPYVNDDPTMEVFTVWYNREEWVESSVSSITNQTFDDFQILAVDDGSTDKTGERLEEIIQVATEKEIGMRVWRKQNQGFTKSLKRGIEEQSDSELIALHGAGDVSHPKRLEIQFELMNSEQDIIATGVSVEKIDENGTPFESRSVPEYPKLNLSQGEIPRLGTHGASMYERTSYLSAGGYRPAFPYAQDVDLYLRLINEGRFKNSQDIYYSKLVTDATIASKADWEKRLNQIICSAAAVESAKIRQQGNPDPIDEISPGDFGALKSIANQGGFHTRDVHRILSLALHQVNRGNISSALMILGILGLRDLSPVSTVVGRYIKSKISNTLS